MLDGDAPTWTSATPTDVEIVLGGDGTCDLELFQDWVPQDGTWSGTTRMTAVKGLAECQMIGTMAAKMMNQNHKPAQVTWGGSFDIEQFWRATTVSGEDDHPVWTQVDAHSATGAGGGQGVVTAYKSQLLAPNRMVVDTTIAAEGCTFDMRLKAQAVE